MLKGNAKKKLRQAVASVMAASLATTYFIPSMSLMRVMAAENENVGTINEEMIGELKASFSTAGGCSVDTKINFTKDGETLTLLELNDELLLRALKHGCKLPLNVSIAGNMVAGSNPGAVTIKINVGMGADDDSAAESLELGEYSVSKVLTEDGNFNLDLSQDIPSDTKYILLQIMAEYEEGVNSTVYVNSVSSVISDIQKPEAPTVSYDDSWTNKPFDIVVKATDTVGVEGIYDENDNRVTTDENPDEYTFSFDPEGPHTFTFYSKDYAQFESDGKLTFTIDNFDDEAPANFDVTSSTTEWTNTPPTITMSVPVKDASGSPTSYYYSIDGKNTFVPVPDNENIFVINTEGEMEVFVKAADLATNETNANNSVIVRYDATAPVVSDLTSSSVGTKTVVSFGVNDNVSGVAHVYYVLGSVQEDYFADPTNEFTELTASEGKYSFETAEATPFTICVVDNANNRAIESGDLKIKPVISDIKEVTTTEDHSVDVDVVINDDSSIDSLDYEFDFDTNLIESIDKSINGNVVTLTINPVKDAFTDSTEVKIKVTDSDGLSDEKTFTVKITEENDPPESSNQHSYTLGQNEKITFNPLTDNTATNKPDTDADNDTLRILEVSELSNPNAGTLTQNDDGSLTFEAAPNWYGNVTFSYTFTDDRVEGDKAPKSEVTITVDNAPDAPTAKPDKISTNEDTTVVIDVLANDTDPDLIPTGVLSGSTGDEFTIISVNGTPVTEGTVVDVANGKVTLTSGKLSFEPELNYNGTTTFEYKMKDSTGFESGAGVTVTVIPVNDPPVIEGYDKDQVYHIDEDSAIIVNGSKTPVPVFSFVVSDPDVTTTDDIMVSATSNTPSIIKSNTIGIAKNGSEFTISLLPVPNANGEVTITVKVSDGITPNTYTYKVVVDPVNDPPVAVNDDMTSKWKVHENKPFTIPVEDILLNDSDVDGDTLRVVDFELVTKNAGTIKDGVFTSNINFEGPVTVKYTIADREEGATDVLTATGQFTFIVTPVDDAPSVKFIGTPESTVCDENCDNGNKLTLTFEVSDIDTEFKDLAFSIDTSNTTLINKFTNPDDFVVTGPDDNGVYTVSFDAYPTAHKYGDCKITLHVTDSTTTTNCEVNVTVNPVQDAPVIFDRVYYAYEGQNIYIIPQSNGYDLDDEILTLVEINGQPLESGKPFVFNGATIDKFSSGFLFTAPPTIPESGKVVLTYTVDDGSETDTARATKNVTIYIEEAPTDVPSVSITTENPRFVRYDAVDPYFDFKVTNGKPHDSSLYSFDPKVIEGVTWEELGTNEDGSTNYRAHLHVAEGIMAGKTVISVCAYSDSGYCSYAYCEVIVNDQNHIPTAEDFKVSTKEGSTYTFTTKDILAHAKDEDGDSLVVSSLELISTTPERAYLKKNVDSEGNVTYTYNPVEMNFFGDVKFKYTVSDKFDNSETKTITLTYENVEDLPIAYTDWYLLNNTDGATINIYTDKASAPEGKDYLLKDDYDHDNWYGANQPIYFVRFEDGEAGKYGKFKYDEKTGVITYTRDGVCPNSHGRVEFYYYISNQDPSSPDFDPKSCAKGTVVVYEDYPHISMGDAAWHSFKEDDMNDHTYEFGFSRGGGFAGNVTLDIEVTEGANLAEVKYDGSATTGSSFKYSVVPNLDANGEVHVKLILKAYDENGEVFSTCSRTDVIYIVPVNDLPELTVTTEDPVKEPNDNWVINEDEKKEFIVTYKDVETEGAALDFKVSVENVDPLKPVVYSSNIDLGEIEVTEVERFNGLVTRKVTMPTLPNMSGEVILTFTVSDGSATSTFVSHGKVLPVDDLPTVNDIEMTIKEDMPLTFDLHDYVMDIDTDISDVKYKLSDSSKVSGVVTVDEETGIVFFRPELNFYGDQEFKYEAGYYVTDAETGEQKWVGSEATVLVHVTPVNDEPVIFDAPSYVVGNEDTPVDIIFKCEDAEDEHLDLKFTYEILSEDKTILLPENISIKHDMDTHKYILTAKPEKDMNGTVKIRVTVTDSGNFADPDEAPLKDFVDIEIFFAPVNDLPDLTPDKYGFTEDDIIYESVLGDEKEYVLNVLGNDSDVETKDKNKLTVSVEGTTKLGGRVVVTSDGHSVRYIPALNVNGEDEFEYSVIDPDGGISKSTVTVLVTPVNTPPTPVLVEETIDEHESISINLLDVGITDIEVDNKELPLQQIKILDVKGKGEGGSPVYGTISLKDGVLKYTETAQISTFVEEVLTYTVTDGASENNISTGTIIISIHPISEPPILKDPSNGDKTISDDSTVWTMYEDNENNSGVFNIDIEDEDTKLDSLMFSVELDENASSIIRQSGVSIEKTATGKRIKLTPIENKNGEFDMSVFVSDGTTEITRNIHVKVIPVNDAPVITDKSKENEIPSAVEYETREETTYTKFYSATDIEDATLDLVFSASKPAHGEVVFGSFGEWKYTPDKDFYGDDTFVITVTDNGEGVSGPKTDKVTVTMHVLPVNDAPSADNVTFVIYENDSGNDTYSIDLASVDGINNGGVIKGSQTGPFISDPDISDVTNMPDSVTNDFLKITSVTGDKDRISFNGTTITYKPVQYNNIPESFEYEITDSEGKSAKGTITIEFIPVNQKPNQGHDILKATEDQDYVEYDILSNDNDPDTNDKFTKTPDTLKILSVTSGDTTITVDKDGNGSGELKTPHGYVKVEDGKFYYKPDLHYYSTDDSDADKFSYTMTDYTAGETYDGLVGNDEVPFNITVNIASVNEDPTISKLPNGDIDEDEHYKVEGVVTDDTYRETPRGELVVTVLSSSNQILVPYDKDHKDNIIVSGPDSEGNFSIEVIPAYHAVGKSTITVQVADKDGGKTTTSFVVNVNKVDSVPEPQETTAETDENTPIYIDVLANDDYDLMFEGDSNLKIVENSLTWEDSFAEPAKVSIVDHEYTDTYYDEEGNPHTRTGTRTQILLVPDSTWTLPHGESKTYTFGYKVTDNSDKPDGYTGAGVLNVTITAVNDKPVITESYINDSEGFALNGAINEDMEADIAGYVKTYDEVHPDPDKPGVPVYSFKVNDEETAKGKLEVAVTNIKQNPTIGTKLLDAKVYKVDEEGNWELRVVPVADQNGNAVVTVTVTDEYGDTNSVDVTVVVNPRNDEPKGGNDSYTVVEDSLATDKKNTFDVLVNDDIDIETNNEALSVSSVRTTTNTHGTVKISDDGTKVIYVPDKDYCNLGLPEGLPTDYLDDDSLVDSLVANGNVAEFYYTAKDEGGTKEFRVIVSVTPVNDAPEITVWPSKTLETTETEPFEVFKVVVKDIDSVLTKDSLGVTVDNSILIKLKESRLYDIKDYFQIKSFTDNGDDTYTYEIYLKPYKKYNGTAALTLVANDGELDSNKEKVNLQVGIKNDMPEVLPDAFVFEEGKSNPLDVLKNDYDEDLETNKDDEKLFITAGSVKFTEEWMDKVGTLEVNADRTMITYKPNPGYEDFNGILKFTYQVDDSMADKLTDLNLTPYHGVDITPVEGRNYCTIEITPANDPPVAGNYKNTAPEDKLMEDSTTGLTIDLIALGYDADLIDNEFGDTGIKINQHANAIANSEVISIKINSVTGNFKNGKTFDLVTGIATTNVGSKISYSADGRSITYIPAPNFNGEDTFTYVITDKAGKTSTGSVTIVVTPDEDNPIAVDDKVTQADAYEDMEPLTIDVLKNDVDIDADTVINLDKDALNGADELYIAGVKNASSDTESKTIVTANGGTVVVAEDGKSLTYEPAKDFFGIDSFIYVAKNENSVNNADEAVVTIDVKPVNDPPVIISYPTETITIKETENFPDITVVVKDIDSELTKDSLSVVVDNTTLIKLDKDHYEIKSFTNNGDDTYTYVIGLKPNEKYNGEAVLTFKANDGALDSNLAEVNLKVEIVNDMPTVLPDSFTTEEGKSRELDVLKNDTDDDIKTNPNDEKLYITEGSVKFTEEWMDKVATLEVNADRTKITYKPNPGYEDFNGTLKFTYEVDDSIGDKLDTLNLSKHHGIGITKVNDVDYCTITVTPSNDLPIAGDYKNTKPEDVLYEDSTTGLTIDLIALGYDADLIDNVFAGTDIKINQYEVEESKQEVISIVDKSISDNFKDGKTFNLVTGVATTKVGSTISYSADGRSITYIPAPNFNGEDTFTYTITDKAGKTSTGTVTIIVTPKEDNPIGVNDVVGQDKAHEDMDPLTIDVLKNDVDIDADTVINLDKSVLNKADELYIAGVKNNSSDTESKTIVTDNGGKVVVAEDGKTLTYEPAPNFNGKDTFIYVVKNENLENNTDEATVTIDVKPEYDAPEAVKDVIGQDVAFEDMDALTIDVLKNDKDIDSDKAINLDLSEINDITKLEITGVKATSTSDSAKKITTTNGGTVVVAEDGKTLSYKPAPNFNGKDSFVYVIANEDGKTSEAVVEIDVKPVADNPEVVKDVIGQDKAYEDMDYLTIDVLKNDKDIDSDKKINLDLDAINDITKLEITGVKATSTSDSAKTITTTNGGTVVVAEDGKTLSYKPAPNFNGKDTFFYEIKNQDGNTSSGEVEIDVKPEYDDPEAVNDVIGQDKAHEDMDALTINVLANDKDIDSDKTLNLNLSERNSLENLKVTGLKNDAGDTAAKTITTAHGGTVVVAEDGKTVSYKPAPNFNGKDSFIYVMANEDNKTSEAVVEIDVKPVADNPEAVKDVIGQDKAYEDMDALTIDVLANDKDIDSDKNINLNLDELNDISKLEIIGVKNNDTDTSAMTITTVHGGTVVVAEDGKTLSYKPAKDFNGKDTFIYEIKNQDGNTSSGEVEIDVKPKYDNPEAVKDVIGQDKAFEDMEPLTINVLANDKDIDSDKDLNLDLSERNSLENLKVTGLKNATGDTAVTTLTTVNGGEVKIADDGKSVTYKPAKNFNGKDSFIYVMANEDNNTSEAVVEIDVKPVADKPEAVKDVIGQDKAHEDMDYLTIDVLKNDKDIDSDKNINLNLDELNDISKLEITGVKATSTSDSAKTITTTNGGTVVVAEDGKTLSYKPAKDFNGKDTFIYEIKNQDGNTSSGEVEIDVKPKYDNPEAVNDVIGQDKAHEDMDALTINVLANDKDIDSDKDLNLDLSERNSLENLKVTGLKNKTTDTAATTLTTVNGGEVKIAADGKSVTYKPAKNFNGKDSFIYVMANEDNNTSEAVVEIDVKPEFDDPEAVNDVIGQDKAYEDMDALTIDVLANDKDIDSDKAINLDLGELNSISNLKVIGLKNATTDAAGTTLTTAHGGVVKITEEGKKVTYKPAPNFNGKDSFIYVMANEDNNTSEAVVEIDVKPEYDDPEAVKDFVSSDVAHEDMDALTIDVLANDKDIDSDTKINLDLTELNSLDKLEVIGLKNKTTDTAGTTLTTVNGGEVKIATDGKTVTYKPAKDFNGLDTFIYVIKNQDGNTSEAVVEIDVDPEEDDPEAVNDVIGQDKAFEDMDALTIDVLANDKDTDSDSNINLGSGANSIDDLKVAGVKNISTDKATATITTAHGGTVVVAADGKTVSYKPAKDFNGKDSFIYVLENKDGNTDEAVVEIDVKPIEDDPEAVKDVIGQDKAYEDMDALTIDVLANDKDIDSDKTINLDLSEINDITKLEVIGVKTDSTSASDTTITTINGGEVKVAADGKSVSYKPAKDFNGKDTFVYVIKNQDGNTSEGLVEVDVKPVADDPEAVKDVIGQDKAHEDMEALTIDVLANDKDIDSDSKINLDAGAINDISKLTITGVKTDSTSDASTTITTINGGTVVVATDGKTLSYKPAKNFNGKDTFVYVMANQDGNTSEAVVEIDVKPIEDNPEAVKDVIGQDKAYEDMDALTIDVLANDKDIDSDKAINLDLTEINDITKLKVIGVKADSTADADTTITTAHGGTVVVAADGKSVSYKPAKNFNGKDSFVYVMANEDNNTSEAIVEIDVKPVADDPEAVKDVIGQDQAHEDMDALTIDVLANDKDVDSDKNINLDAGAINEISNLVITGVKTDSNSASDTTITTVNGGEVKVAADGKTVSYKPAPNFNGKDTFNYVIKNQDGNTSEGLVEVDVKPLEDDPEAVKDVIGQDKAYEDMDALTINVLANDKDIDSDGKINLDLTEINSIDKLEVIGLKNEAADTAGTTLTTVNGGEVKISADGKTVSYKPAPNFNGKDSFIYVMANEDGNTSEAVVEIDVKPVDDNPTATKDVVTSDVAYEDMPAMEIDVLANDDDIDSHKDINLDSAVNDIDNLKIVGVKNETSDTEEMTLTTVNGGEVIVATDGKTLTYKPALNFNGKDSFIYVIENEDGNQDEAVVEIDVDPREDDPEAVADEAKVDEDSSVVIEVLANDKDIDSVKEINLNEDAINDFDKLVVTGIKIDDSSDEEPNEITTMNGGKAVIAEDGKSITYTPAPNYNGPDSFVYVITNEDGNTSEAKVDIYVNPVMDDPTAVDDVVSSDIAYEDMDALTINVLDNDSDTDSDTAINLDPEINDLDKMKVVGLKNSKDDEATTTLTTVNGGTVVISNGGKTVDYKPAANFNGIDSFIYVIANEDGNKAEATVTIDVKPEEDNPTAVADKVSLDEDSSLVINVLDNDSDIDSDKDINLNLDAINSGNLVITGVVDSEDKVVNEFTTDNGGKVKVSEDGKTISYTPAANFNGPDSFIYQITNDDGNLAEAEVSVYVNPVNDNPTAMPDEAIVDEDGSIEIDVLANDSDIDSDESINLDEEALNTKGLTVSGVMASEDGEAATTIKTNNGGTVTVKDNKVTYEPATNYYGPDSFYYEVTNEDGSKSVELVSITVNPVNDAPVAKDYEVTYKEDEADYYDFNLVALGLIDDNDLVLDKNEVLTVTIESADVRSPLWVSVDNTAGSNTITFNPPENFYGDYVINYKVTDAYGEASDAKIIVHVLPVNDPPVAKDYEVTYKEDEKESYEFNLVELMLIDDVDLMLDDNESLTVTVDADGTTNPDWVSVTNESGANKIKFTPVENYNGTFVITYTVTDAYGESATAKITIVIEPVGDGPVANPDEATTLQDESVVIKPLENDTDIDSDELFVDPDGFAGLEDGAKVTVNKETGEVTYTPAPGFYGKDTFSYTVMDAEGNKAVSTITVTVIKADFSIKVETDKDTFDSAEAGYENAPESIEVTITNTGNKPVEILPPNWNNFTTTLEEPVVILPGETVSFEVKPIVGLKPGNYSGDFTINTNQGITGSVNLNFVVTDILTLTSHVIGEGGTASYVGHKTINGDEVIVLTFTPYDGYRIKEVMINGVSQGAVDRVTINGTDKSIVVTVEFEKIPTSTSGTTKTGEDKSKNNLAALGLLSVATALAALKKKFKKEEEE